MPTIRATIERLMPTGSNPEESTHDRVPLWPPDLFAVCATLARVTECYTLAAVRGAMGLGVDHVREVTRIGEAWSAFEPDVEPWLQERWATLLNEGARPVGVLRDHDKFPKLLLALVELLAAADEASAGVGFGGDSDVAHAARKLVLQNQGATLCRCVREDEACVLPKGRTPNVGCNLRSLSQHLALVPASTQVSTAHFEAREPLGADGSGTTELGVLLVPFPYKFETDDFQEESVRPPQPWARLRLGCSWHSTKPDELVEFVESLIAVALKRGRQCDVVVFPELALTREMFTAIVERVRGPRLFVAGVLEQAASGPPKNLACGYFREQNALRWEQAKHHRWRIERYQVSNYGLANLRPDGFTGQPSALDDPAWKNWYGWWEDIDIKDRRVVTARFHQGATVSTLVCEDLSRVDPVQPVLRELGPTWLIALLMDGPQYPSRWAAQGAGAFADDPGSSVLVLTSLGLIQRSRDHREQGRGESHAAIGLWRDPQSAAKVLELPASAHALHLALYTEQQRELTLDGRGDGGQAVVVKLRKDGVQPLSVERPPAWVHPFQPS